MTSTSSQVSIPGRTQSVLRVGALALALAFPLIGHAQGSAAAPAAAAPAANAPAAEYVPNVGQSGKDVVWVPTPQTVVDKMLELAKITPQDRLMDLGSGDGRTVITAAQRGLTAKGIEYNPEMAELARRNAAKAGVSERATFETADLFKTDLSQADVITMFLLPSINEKLRPTILDLEPGTRIVSNTFRMGDWAPDVSETVTQDCSNYCTALLWIVPAKVGGKWMLDGQTLELQQSYQQLSGRLGDKPISDARLDGKRIQFTVDGARYEGEVDGQRMAGKNGSASWSARRG